MEGEGMNEILGGIVRQTCSDLVE